MTMLHIDLNVAPEELTGTAVDDNGQIWPVEGWLSLIGIIDRTRRQNEPAPPSEQAPILFERSRSVPPARSES